MAKNKPKPETEVRLDKLQTEYLKDRSVDLYKQMFLELIPYARSLALKKTKSRAYLSPDYVDEIAVEATIKFMTQYEREDFKIDASFAGILSYKVLEAMYGPKIKAADNIRSLNSHIDSCKNTETELGDLPKSMGFIYLFRPTNSEFTDDPASYLFDTEKDAIDNATTVIQDMRKKYDFKSYFLVTVGLIQFIKKSKNYDNYRQMFLNEPLQESLDACILELFNRLKNVA